MKQKVHYDQGTHELPQLNPGDRVRVQDYSTNQWSQDATVVKTVAPRSYEVTTDGGATLRRNRRSLRLSHASHALSIPYIPEDTPASSVHEPGESSCVGNQGDACTKSPVRHQSSNVSQRPTELHSPAVRRSTRQVQVPSRLIENM